MFKWKFGLAFLSAMLFGCSSGGGSTLFENTITLQVSCDDANNIQGCWETIGCEEIDHQAQSDDSVYGRNIYSFRSTGIIQLETRLYNTPDCSSGLVSSTLSDSSIAYAIGDEVLANDGTEAQEIFIDLTDEFGFVTTHLTIFALLNGSELCTTESLQLLPSEFITSNGGSTLDYENCLLRYE